MMLPYRKLIFCIFLCSLFYSPEAFSQDNGQVYVQGRKFVDINIRSLDRYSKRWEVTQRSLLKKLKRKEQRLVGKLKRNDSAGYARLQSQSLSFDSILNLSRRPDSATIASRTLKNGQKSIDSLKGIINFIQGKDICLAGSSPINSDVTAYTKELNNLQGKLSYQQYISELTQQHVKSLEGIAGSKNGITGISKELFYAKSKVGEWKKLADEPSKAEQLALEYLQGTKGFDASMKGVLKEQGTGMASATSAADLEAAGFQTKRMMNAALQQKFGNNLSALQGNMAKDVGQWQDKVTGLSKEVKTTRQSLQSVKKRETTGFKVNPMRGLPFRQRLEQQFSFTTRRATSMTDGIRSPALLSLSAGLAYRHRPKLKTGVAIAGDIGLGENWSAIRFSFEGVGLRTFAIWELMYGIGVYGGYERTWRLYAFTGKAIDALPATISPSTHLTDNYSDAVLLGLTKQYRINSKWNGAIQVLFDAFWMEKGLRSPLVLRFVNIN